MVTAKTQYNLKNAEDYFKEHLCVGDYYDEGQRVSGEWIGLGAEKLGLSGKVRAEEFLRLCENQHPSSGETLTQRLNTTRTESGQSTANRRIFFDFTFSPPKSVSLAAFLGKDERILQAHARAVRSALREFEAFTATRIRLDGAQTDRLTGNFTAALFTHDTSRALDPHVHTHCIVFNATFDPVENRWKALQNYELLRARKFAENAYYHELTRELRGFGYRIQNRARGDFQIEGTSDELCRRFSKRRAEIDQAMAKLLDEKPELAGGDVMATRRLLATAERARKQRDLSRDELNGLWESQLTREERETFSRLCGQPVPTASSENRTSVNEAVQWAEEHLFDRNSVVLECQVWQEALGRARGESFSVSDLKEFTQRRGYIRDEARPGEVTLREVLLREWEIVHAAKEGVGDCLPLVANPRPANPQLDNEQRHALESPVELHKIRRQDPALGRDVEERNRIRRYRKAVEAAAAGKLGDSFELLDKMGAIVACGIGEQADKLADEYLRLAEQNASAVVVSQTWGEVHHVNSRVRDALKGKGLLGAADSAVQALERMDLTNAQKRDMRFYPQDAVIVFNQKVRNAQPGAKGKLAGILKSSVLIEVGGKFVMVSNQLLDRITVCQAREIFVADGDRLHLKANRKLASGGRVTNGELVTVKSVRADGGVELTDGRVLDKSFREFLPGYAVTSYGSQGKTVDYVLFSDSTVKPATNAQQWYVTISRGRRGIRIFTPDKQQLRENITRSGHRPLAMEFAAGSAPRGQHLLWNRLHGYLIRFGRRAAERIFRLHLAQQHQPKHQTIQKHEHKNTRMLGQRPTGTRITH